jgi:hypothetical protein
MVEIAKEERIGHFIETYYRAAAEVFEFQYGECDSKKQAESESRDAIKALEKVGFILRTDDETISKYVKLVTKIESTGSNPEIEEKIADTPDIGLLEAQHARHLARSLSMTDKQFEEYQTMEKEARSLLRSKLVETRQAVQHSHKSTR